MQTNIESTVKQDKAKFDFPTVPLKLMNTQYMTKKEKDKLKKKQEKLDHCLELLEIEEKEFLHLMRDDPSKIRSFLNHVLMTRITALSAGGDAEVMKVRTGSTSSSEKSPKGSKGRRGSATEEVLKAQAKRRGSSGEVFKGPSRQSKKGGKRQVVADKHTLHEAYYWLIETYVDNNQDDDDDQN